MNEDFGGGEEIAFERRGAAGLVRLNRPKALNALTHDMVKALHKALGAWAEDPSVACVIVEGEGRAFCAGGDLMAIYRGREAGSPPYGFFADEYRLNRRVRRFPKPYVSFLDGIVMGGGVGISVHGSHRLVTENTVFAMPETSVGFFPDVGGSAFLPYLPRHFGLYLALTGARVGQGDCLASGIATHAVAASVLPEIRESLIETGDVAAALEGRTVTPGPETPVAKFDLIDACFSALTLNGIVDALSQKATEGDEMAAAMLTTLESRSPTSLAVTFHQMQEGRYFNMEGCMRMEYRILHRMLQEHDFYEGIRTILIDKGDTPRWRPDTLAGLDPAAIDAYFTPLGDEDLLFQ